MTTSYAKRKPVKRTSTVMRFPPWLKPEWLEPKWLRIAAVMMMMTRAQAEIWLASTHIHARRKREESFPELPTFTSFATSTSFSGFPCRRHRSVSPSCPKISPFTHLFRQAFPYLSHFSVVTRSEPSPVSSSFKIFARIQRLLEVPRARYPHLWTLSSSLCPLQPPAGGPCQNLHPVRSPLHRSVVAT